jgi:hypothetical protein
MISLLKRVIDCKSAQIFLFDPIDSAHQVPKSIEVQKSVFQNQYITLVNSFNDEVENPKTEKLG